MAKKNSGGLFGALTMKQTDALARTIGDGASKLKDVSGRENHDTVMELFEVTKDLHDSWTTRADQGEKPGIYRRFLR
jgi:hypothetical protein